MESQFSVTAGQSLPSSQLGFLAYGAVIENITNQWYFEPSRRRWIPPYQAGVTIPLIGSTMGQLDCKAPGATAQVGPVVGEYLTVSYTDTPIPAGGGINVNTGLPVQVSSLDYTQGARPGNPIAGLTRVWADVTGALHRLLSTGADFILADTLLLDVAESTDILSATAIAANVETQIGTRWILTKANASSLLLFTVQLGLVVAPTATGGELAAALWLDDGAPRVRLGIGANFATVTGTAGTAVSGGARVLAGVAAGAHAVQLAVISSVAGTMYCRAASLPSSEFSKVQAVELIGG